MTNEILLKCNGTNNNNNNKRGPGGQSEFKSRWSWKFFCKFVFEKNENKLKKLRLAHFYKKKK